MKFWLSRFPILNCLHPITLSRLALFQTTRVESFHATVKVIPIFYFHLLLLAERWLECCFWSPCLRKISGCKWISLTPFHHSVSSERLHCRTSACRSLRYRKIPKISPGAYVFQRPFLRGLFLEGLIFGRAYLRREICVSKSNGLPFYLAVNLPFLLCFTLYLRAIFQVQTPGGLIFGGAI